MSVHPLFGLAKDLSQCLGQLRFPAPVAYVYDPTGYAAAPMHEYFRRFGAAKKKTLFLGMNPGPWGMAQTGVPFGEVAAVRDWMGIRAPVTKPVSEHPKRPIQGLDCTRSEVSGRRLWGGIADWFDSPAHFFVDHFVANYCPLLFLEASGRNYTPDKLPAAARRPLLAACDAHLARLVDHLGVEIVVGVGKFAEAAARRALSDRITIATVLHPSPASPAANRGWQEQARQQLTSLGIL